jgi:ribosomal protein L11 methylase PrmA
VLPGFLTENSTLILSGILDTRLTDVTSAIEKAGLSVTEVYQKEDWRCITAKKEN